MRTSEEREARAGEESAAAFPLSLKMEKSEKEKKSPVTQSQGLPPPPLSSAWLPQAPVCSPEEDNYSPVLFKRYSTPFLLLTLFAKSARKLFGACIGRVRVCVQFPEAFLGACIGRLHVCVQFPEAFLGACIGRLRVCVLSRRRFSLIRFSL